MLFRFSPMTTLRFSQSWSYSPSWVGGLADPPIPSGERKASNGWKPGPAGEAIWLPGHANAWAGETPLPPGALKGGGTGVIARKPLVELWQRFGKRSAAR